MSQHGVSNGSKASQEASDIRAHMEMRCEAERTLQSRKITATQVKPDKRASIEEPRGEKALHRRESTGKAGGKQGESQGKAGPKKGKPVSEGGKNPNIYNTGVFRNRPELPFYNIKREKERSF